MGSKDGSLACYLADPETPLKVPDDADLHKPLLLTYSPSPSSELRLQRACEMWPYSSTPKAPERGPACMIFGQNYCSQSAETDMKGLVLQLEA